MTMTMTSCNDVTVRKVTAVKAQAKRRREVGSFFVVVVAHFSRLFKKVEPESKHGR